MYFKKWYLKLNPNKTTALALHLNNKEVEKKLNLKVDGVPMYIQRTLPNASTYVYNWIES